MKIKTQELTGAALDWAVAKCEGFEPFTDGISWIIDIEGAYQPLPKYSSDWSQGGPIIEREKIALVVYWNGRWVAEPEEAVESVGPTPLTAAMRCLVARKIGVEVPEELCERS